MKKLLTIYFGICLVFLSCQNEKLDNIDASLNAESASEHHHGEKDKQSVGLLRECDVINLNRCDLGHTSNFWWAQNPGGWSIPSTYFASDELNNMVFSEYEDGTANVKGTTMSGTCIVEVDVWFKDKKDWITFSSEGGSVKDEPNDCTGIIKENQHYYVIDSARSMIKATGGDCLQEGTFGVEQRPDPNDPNTPHLGVIVGPGGGLFDNSDPLAYGLSTWGWLTENAPGGTDCNDCSGKLTDLTFQNTGSTDANVLVMSKAKKNNPSEELFNGTLPANEIFSIYGFDDKGTLGTEITVTIDGTEYKVHTSCSDPNVVPGYMVGNLEIIEGASLNGGALCGTQTDLGARLSVFDFNFNIECPEIPCGPCEGKATSLTLQNNGMDAQIRVEMKAKKDQPANVVYDSFVLAGGSFSFNGNDDKGTLGTEITIYVDEVEHTKIHTSCSKPLGSGLIKGDFEVISGYSKDGGELCPVEDCYECKGKVTELQLEYNGTEAADIVVKTKGKGKHKEGDVIFESNVAAGGLFTLIGTDKHGTLGTEISIYVNGTLDAKIHTSCSDPIGPGIVKGNFTVVRGASRDGGELCPAENPPGGEECACEGKIVKMSVIYDGPSGVEVTVTGKDGGLATFTNVQNGDTLTSNLGNQGTWWYYAVNGTKEADIHTSCSDDILGNVNATKSTFGNSGTNGGDTFLVISHTDEKGNTCSIGG